MHESGKKGKKGKRGVSLSRGIIPGQGMKRVRRARRLLEQSRAGAERAPGVAVGAGGGSWEAAVAPPLAAGVLESGALADLRRLARRLDRLRAALPAIGDRIELSDQAERLIAGESEGAVRRGRIIPFRPIPGGSAAREYSEVWLAE